MGILLSVVPWWGRLLAIGAVLVAAAAFGAVKMHAHDQKRYDALNVAYANFRADVKAKGDIASAQAKAQEARQKEVEHALSAELARADNDYVAAVKRLRERPPSRPDGSSVPVASCSPQGPSGSPDAEQIPLADYRALESRAAYDAQTVELYRQLVQGLVASGALAIK